ncbi:MAG TPA: hypothetical protein VLF67_05300 [Candidatus Saccharimonas sp.]|nr:hypothetical protein [Candidatus Saccharimonas sp.]
MVDESQLSTDAANAQKLADQLLDAGRQTGRDRQVILLRVERSFFAGDQEVVRQALHHVLNQMDPVQFAALLSDMMALPARGIFAPITAAA